MSRLLFAFLLLPVSVQASECADFTGRYVWHTDSARDLPVVLTITQNGCDSVSAQYDHGHGVVDARPMVFDGQFHVTFKNDGLTIQEAFTISTKEITVQGKIEHTSDGSVYFDFGRIYLDTDGSLVEESNIIRDDGTTSTSSKAVYVRE